MVRRYITLAEAEAIRRRVVVRFTPDVLMEPGVIGVTPGIDYYIVPDDDPRLSNEQRLRALGHDGGASFTLDD